MRATNIKMTDQQIMACEHDFRRVFVTDINAAAPPSPNTLCVCCRNCGRSPLYFLRRGTSSHMSAAGDWPRELKIVGYFWDEEDGPRVEYRMREDDNAAD